MVVTVEQERILPAQKERRSLRKKVHAATYEFTMDALDVRRL